MKGYDLLKGMGHIDDDLVAEALEAEVAAAPEERKAVRLSRFAGSLRWQCCVWRVSAHSGGWARARRMPRRRRELPCWV